MDQPELLTSASENLALQAGFLFVACQPGGERALKQELARRRPELRFAFSRPGFVTFKLPEGHGLEEDAPLAAVFGRTHGFSLGKATGGTDEERAAASAALASRAPPAEVHVWSRLELRPGHEADPEDAAKPDVAEPPVGELGPLGAIDRAAAALAGPFAGLPIRTPTAAADEPPTAAGLRVLDVILVDDGEWWIGFHRTRSGPSRWPGGRQPLTLPPHAVSRAYLKMTEALRWSKLPIAAGQTCLELGSAPGGAAQCLLEQGLLVRGVDPARMHESLLAHPRFTHLNKRGKELRRQELVGAQWLFADMNVAPNYTLDCVEDLLAGRHATFDGMILTLKLIEWELADQLDEYLERIRGWGFRDVRARQLQHNRQEVCVAALRKHHMR